jgi:phosphate transport system permease protein
MRRGPADRTYFALLAACALVVPLLLGAVVAYAVHGASPLLADGGAASLVGSTWSPSRGLYGALPAIAGTLVTSLLALLIAAPLGLGVAITVAELAPPGTRGPLGALVDLLAAIPSVVFGLWGVLVLVPWLRDPVMPFLRDTLGLGALPFFRGVAYGPSVLAAALVLAIMVLPYVAAVSREVIATVPVPMREAALAVGATRWEMLRDVVLPAARTGLVGGLLLGLGRALGETMAVTMVIGNRHALSASLFSPGYTLASVIANEFGEARDERHLAALLSLALVLLAVTLVVNAAARLLVRRAVAA